MITIRGKDDIPLIQELRAEIDFNKDEMLKVEKSLPVIKTKKAYNELKKNQSHYILNKNVDVGRLIREQLFCDYGIKRLAQKSFCTDIEESFYESVVSDEPLGVVLKNGKLVPSNEMKVEFVGVAFWEGERYMGMPFKINSIRLV